MILALPPLYAESVFFIGTFPITNTYINSTIVLLLFAIAGFIIRKRTEIVPKGLQNFIEYLIEFVLEYIDRVTLDRKKSIRFLPIVGGLFFFILISNWMGLLPGIGSIGRWLEVHHKAELVPIFRPANTDLNMTLAMAVFAVAVSHIIGIITIGFFKYVNKFIKLIDIYKSFKKGGMSIAVAIIEFFVGFIEIFSEIAKMVSLSLRLFGNIFAGEVLLTVLAGLIAYFVPLPFMFLELLVGLVQAVVFSMLTLVYLTVATSPVHGHDEAERSHHEGETSPAVKT